MNFPQLVLNVYSLYTLSNSRKNFDLKYQMAKHNMHVNLLFCTKAFLFVCENTRCGQTLRKASSRSTNHSFPGMICWVSQSLRRNIFRAIETKNAAPFIGRFLSFSHFHTFQSHVGHSISLVYSKLLTLSVTNSKLLMKVQLSERQFLDRNHAEKVLTVTCLITFCI